MDIRGGRKTKNKHNSKQHKTRLRRSEKQKLCHACNFNINHFNKITLHIDK